MSTTIQIFLALFTAWFICNRFLIKARIHGEVPLTDEQRYHRWKDKVNTEMGWNTEERLQLAVKGAEAKRRILAHMRNRKVEPPKDMLEIGERLLDGPWVTRLIRVQPLKHTLNKPLVQIIRKPLRLARMS